ncbi:MAG: matrixin family metalloprotease, partial [Kofleriaceae bacterium]
MKLITSLIAITAFGCSTSPDLGSTAGMSFEEFRASVQSQRDAKGTYTLEWDLPIRGDQQLYDYWLRSRQGGLTVYNIGGEDIVWNNTQKKHLTYCIGSTFSATQKAAIAAAMVQATDNGWSKMADVKFVHVAAQDGVGCTAANNAVMFDVNLYNSNGQFLARAFFPNDTREDRNVLVDPDSFDPSLDWPLSNIMGHELGHTLGFRHEHIRSPGQECPEDDDFRAITS